MNVSDKLEQRLSGVRLAVLRELSQLAAVLGLDLYLVGGTVRDVLSDAPLTDIDIMAAGNAERLVESIRGRGDATVRKASAFGTWSMIFQGVEVDLSTARRETYEHPGALPTVFPGEIEDDLARRDFSINSMAISLGAGSWGKLLDPHGGITDLERRLIRVLHDRSFEDDGTRILRAVRYACRLDFRLEDRTAMLLKCSLPYMSAISPDRVRNEIERIFRERHADEMIEMAGRLRVLAAIHPALRADPSTHQTIECDPQSQGRRAELLLGSMVQSVGDCEVESIIERLNLNAHWARLVRDVATVRTRLPELKDENVTRSRAYRLMHGLHVHAVESCAMAVNDPTVAGWLRLYLDELRHVRPMLNGDDLMRLGVREGPEVGMMLTQLLDARLDGLVVSVEDERELVGRALRG